MTDLIFYIKKGDTLPAFKLTVNDEVTGNPINLTGVTIKFYMENKDTGLIKINGATATNPSAGTMEYQWIATDTNTVGWFFAEFEVTFPNLTVIKYPQNGYIKVHILDKVE